MHADFTSLGEKDSLQSFPLKVMIRFLVVLITLLFAPVGQFGIMLSCVFSSNLALANPCLRMGKEFIISDDIDLKGGTWELPRKSKLAFCGGSVRNGIIVFSETDIVSSEDNVPSFWDIRFSGKIRSKISPTWFHGSTWSVTELLQNCFSSCDVVDLDGEDYHTSKLIIRSGLSIVNGALHFNNLDYCLYGVGVNGFSLSNVVIDGGGSSGCAVFISDSRDVIIDRVSISDIYSKTSSAAGIYLRRCRNSTIQECQISDVVSVPNGMVGDSPGASRAIIIQHCFNSTISRNEINHIISSEDGDGIHIINEADDLLGNILIINNTIKNCSRRHIKVQAKGVFIQSNQLLTDEDGYHLDYTVSIFSSNCSIENNTFNAASSVPIQIGSGLKTLVTDISICNNTILDTGRGSQGSVTVGSLISRLTVNGNRLTLLDGNECGVYIRSSCQNIIIRDNILEGGRGLIFIREDTPDCYVKSVEISGNEVKTTGYFFALTVPGEAVDVSKIDIIRNTVSVTSPTYQGDVVFVTPLSAKLRNHIHVVDNENEGSMAFNRRVRGVSSVRPTKLLNKENKGFRFYDESLGRTIIWNGTDWE